MKTLLRFTNTLILWLTLATASAQQMTTQVIQIYETRISNRWEGSTGPSLFITLEMLGLEVSPTRLIKLEKITRAEDNLGNALTDGSGTPYTYLENPYYDIHFTAPLREAREIAKLEGTFRYFTPTLANKGLIHIDNPVSKLGTNIMKGKYKEVVMVLLDRKKLQELKAGKPNLYTKEREKLKKEYGGGAESLDELDTVLDDSTFGSENELFFFIHDPKGTVLRLTILDAEGNTLSNSASSATGGHISYALETPLDKTLKLELTVESPQSVKIIPFSITNIQLP